MPEPTPNQNPSTVTVVATSAFASIDFYLNLLIALLALFANDFKDLIKPEYLRYVLLLSAALNIVVKQLQTRPTTLTALPGQTVAQQVPAVPASAITNKEQ